MRRAWGLPAAAAALLIAGCTGAPEQHDQIVLAEAQDLGGYNPVTGYGDAGVSPIYEGLFRPQADSDDAVPDLVPSLAAGEPDQLAARQWRIPLRTDVTFSDGTRFDAADVVATYTAVRDPAVASDIATQVATVAQIRADGADAVIVDMHTDADPKPYLLLGIAPSERVERQPAANWALNRDPVGTGPYRLDSLRPDQAVLVARDDYWGEPAQVRRIVYTHTPDDNVRAQRILAGEVDGVNLPPKLINSISRDGIDTTAVQSADWRGIALPAGNAFTADPQARSAMNLAVDRHAMIRDVLDGYGRPASNPVAAVYGPAYQPAAQFDYAPDRAATALDNAGWTVGPDGIREKDGLRASFELLYHAPDTLRRDLAVAFAAGMRPLGIDIRTRGTSWDDMETRTGDAAILLGGGSTPYSIDSQVYDTLHTRAPDSSPYANPGNFTAPGLDALLDRARELPSGPAKDDLYRQIQDTYATAPSHVFLVFLDHTYGSRDRGWNQVAPILEPHSHGVTWGPWWDIGAWTR